MYNIIHVSTHWSQEAVVYKQYLAKQTLDDVHFSIWLPLSTLLYACEHY